MDIIKTSIVVTKTIKNVARLKEIISVFAKNGFDEFISGKVTSSIPDFVLPSSKIKIKDELAKRPERDWSQIIGYRLRKCFEELGPSFIKFGQLLSTREDVFDSAFIHEMGLLRDQAAGIPYDVATQIIEAALGRKINELFSIINPEPIGKASIGVVFEGKLHDGQEVVIKVRRPHITKIIETDFNILGFLIAQVEKLSEELRCLGISKIIDDFESSLQNELNFNMEALNCVRFERNIKKHDGGNIFYIPRVYTEYTTEEVLVLEKLNGIPFSDTEHIALVRNDLQSKLQQAIRIFAKTYLQDGFFHADLHSGNLFWMNDGRIGIIDYGLMGNLSRKGRQNFVAILYALLTHNYENLVYEFLDVAEYEVIPDTNKLIYDVRHVLHPYVGLNFSEINSSQMLNMVVKTMMAHKLFTPREWITVFRSLMTLDGSGKALRIDCDFFGELESNIHEFVGSSINKDELIEEGVWAIRDLMSFSRLLPRHMKWFAKEWAHNNFAFEVKSSGYKTEISNLASSVLFLAYSLLMGVFAIAGVMTWEYGSIKIFNNLPLVTSIFWSISFFWFVLSLFVLKKIRYS